MSRKIDIEWIRANKAWWIYFSIFLLLLSSCTPYDPQPGDKNPPKDFCNPALLSHSPECIDQMLQPASNQQAEISEILAMDYPIVIGVVTSAAMVEPSQLGKVIVISLALGGFALIADGNDTSLNIDQLINNPSISFSQEFAKRNANLGLSAFLAYSVVKHSNTITIKAASPEMAASLDMEKSEEHLSLILELAKNDPQLLFDLLGSNPAMSERLEGMLGSSANDYREKRGYVPSGSSKEADQELTALVGAMISAQDIDRIKEMNRVSPRIVVLVEDDAIPATIIQTLLTSLGFRVDHYRNCDDYYVRQYPYGPKQVIATIFDWDYQRTDTGKLSDSYWTTNKSCMPDLKSKSRIFIVFTGRTQATSEMGSEPILYKNYSQLFQRLLRLILDTLAEQQPPDLKKQFVDNREQLPRPDLKSLLAGNMVNGNPVHGLMNHDRATPDGQTWKF